MNYSDIKARILASSDRRMKLIDILYRFHDTVKRSSALDGASCLYHPGDFIDEIEALYGDNKEV